MKLVLKEVQVIAVGWSKVFTSNTWYLRLTKAYKYNMLHDRSSFSNEEQNTKEYNYFVRSSFFNT